MADDDEAFESIGNAIASEGMGMDAPGNSQSVREALEEMGHSIGFSSNSMDESMDYDMDESVEYEMEESEGYDTGGVEFSHALEDGVEEFSEALVEGVTQMVQMATELAVETGKAAVQAVTAVVTGGASLGADMGGGMSGGIDGGMGADGGGDMSQGMQGGDGVSQGLMQAAGVVKDTLGQAASAIGSGFQDIASAGEQNEQAEEDLGLLQNVGDGAGLLAEGGGDMIEGLSPEGEDEEPAKHSLKVRDTTGLSLPEPGQRIEGPRHSMKIS